MLDISIVNLALPQLAAAFKLAPNDLGWVTNAYLFAGVTVARLGPAVVMKTALATTTAAAIVMIFYSPSTPDLPLVLVGLILGAATSVGQVSTAVGAISEFANRDAGNAAGVFNTLRQVGSIVGGAVPASACLEPTVSPVRVNAT